MNDPFIVGAESHVWREDDQGLADLLRSRHLYKSLSLVLAQRARVKVPASLLLLATRCDLIATFADKWGLPLMIRVDYQRRQKSKPIGGIPLYRLDTACRVSEDLLNRSYLPLFHPHLDRFKDMFSSGVLLSRTSKVAECEVVGEGFDAGDLRLGKAVPHESFRLDLASGNCSHHKTISGDIYKRERSARAKRIQKLSAYVDAANQLGNLLSDFSSFENRDDPRSKPRLQIPSRYRPMPNQLKKELHAIVGLIKNVVLRGLPESSAYVASLSYLKTEGWVLWDVYGDWYER